MRRNWLFLLTAFAFPLSVHADIYKCVTHYVVTYQDKPCPAADEETLVVASLRQDERPPAAEPAAIIVAPEPAPQPTIPNAPPAPELTLGMLDTQVLNMPGWGRPAKITRARGRDAWRERWTYESPQSGERQLQFANGRLVAIGDGER